MERTKKGSGRSRYWLFPLAYALWLANGALAALLLALGRQVVLRLTVVFHWGPYVMGVVDKFGLLVLGIVWLGWMVYAEDRYRTAAGAGAAALSRTTWRTMLAPVVALAAMSVPLLVLRP